MKRQCVRCRTSTAWWSRRTRTSWPTPAALADRAGLYACPHTGVALAVAGKLARQGVIRPGQRVVVISTAHGLKFSEFKIGYHEGALADVVARYRNPPVELPADAGTVKAEIARWLEEK